MFENSNRFSSCGFNVYHLKHQLNTTSLVKESIIRLVELTELTALLAQSVERVDCTAGGRKLDSRGRDQYSGS